MDEMPAPTPGMTISVPIRQDVVIVDPERFVASAREAYREASPEITEGRAAEEIRDVYAAVWALLDRFGRLAPDAPASAGLPGQRVLDRPDGLSPAGEWKRIVLDDPQPLQDYGCFMPEGYDSFAIPSGV
ncbi:hypothetical protein [Streptomyces sp. NBC_01198]|uniref:hypothetical protein n=1 Tax=Streptomyces sp. NBC_01198 TaxID=2903769 RepID=UPI002E0FA6FE|nr:hypothetical protein OG702_05160 [Streptomyces sp. NBC_01198]